MSVFVAENWLTSAFDALTDFIRSEINDYVRDNTSAPAGLEVYEVVMGYPTADELPKPAEFLKTIIHFEIDDIDNKRLGFGDNVVDALFVDPTLADAGTVQEAESESHEINFDVGVWASDKSGGLTSRLRAYEMLHAILGTELGHRKCMETTEGVEIRRFNNGRFVIEKQNDIRLYRMVGAELVVRVFSRTVGVPTVFSDEEPGQPTTVKTADGDAIVDS